MGCDLADLKGEYLMNVYGEHSLNIVISFLSLAGFASEVFIYIHADKDAGHVHIVCTHLYSV